VSLPELFEDRNVGEYSRKVMAFPRFTKEGKRERFHSEHVMALDLMLGTINKKGNDEARSKELERLDINRNWNTEV
jgi:hypothetical protein